MICIAPGVASQQKCHRSPIVRPRNFRATLADAAFPFGATHVKVIEPNSKGRQAVTCLNAPNGSDGTVVSGPTGCLSPFMNKGPKTHAQL
jgi:hypothetical protein